MFFSLRIFLPFDDPLSSWYSSYLNVSSHLLFINVYVSRILLQWALLPSYIAMYISLTTHSFTCYPAIKRKENLMRTSTFLIKALPGLKISRSEPLTAVTIRMSYQKHIKILLHLFFESVWTPIVSAGYFSYCWRGRPLENVFQRNTLTPGANPMLSLYLLLRTRCRKANSQNPKPTKQIINNKNKVPDYKEFHLGERKLDTQMHTWMQTLLQEKCCAEKFLKEKEWQAKCRVVVFNHMGREVRRFHVSREVGAKVQSHEEVWPEFWAGHCC